MWTKVAEIKEIGGMKKLEILLSQAQQSSGEITSILQEIESSISGEENQDREYRSEQSNNWLQITSSDHLNQAMRADHANYSKLLRDAAGSDSLVERLLQTHRTTVSSLDVPRSELDGRMPQMSSEVASRVAPVRNELVALLKELNVLLKNRTTAVAALRSSIDRDDIMNELTRLGCGVPSEGLEIESKENGGGVVRWGRQREDQLFREAQQKH